MLSIPQKVTIQSVAGIHDQIAEHLENSGSVVIDLSDAADIDLSLVQLVECARRQAQSTGRSVRLAQPANASVTGLLRRAGFLTDLSPADNDFWFHGALPQ